MTKGMRSSEFWVTILSALVISLEALVSSGEFGAAQQYLIGSLTILTSIYTVSRSYVKGSRGGSSG